MRNEILKILWFSVFICSDVFSLRYDVLVVNRSSGDILLSQKDATSVHREIGLVDLSDVWKEPDPFKGMTIKKNDHTTLRVDGQPYSDKKVEKFDSLQIEGKITLCEFKHSEGNRYVYPTLPSEEATNTFKPWQEGVLIDGRTCVLTQDMRGSNFTLTISGTPNNSMIGSNSSSSSQESQKTL